MPVLQLALDTPGVFPSFVTVIVSSPCGVCLLLFSVLFLCLPHSAFHQVGNGEPVSEDPTQDSCFQTYCLWLPLEYCRPVAVSRRELSLGAVLSVQCHWCPYSSTAERCIRWVTYWKLLLPAAVVWLVSMCWRAVHFSLNDRHFNTYSVVQLSLLWE